MSSKAHSKQSVPRKIPQIETIITRHKSAQLRRQLRNKQDTVTKINQMTQLLRSPSKSEQKNAIKTSPDTTKSSPRKVKNAQKRTEKRKRRISEKNGSREFYPNTLKRKIEAKKVLLKPKHDLKVIGKTKLSKRKLSVPQKGIRSPVPWKHPRSDRTPSTSRHTKSGSPVHSELSIEEIVRLTDESESLNDEDWLEILTCPSPVWWEDPPDAQFSEDAISSQKLATAETQKKETSEEKKTDINETNCKANLPNEQITNITDSNISGTKLIDDKFINKRNKLENLLGSLKTKLGCANIPLSSDNLSPIKTKNDNLSYVSISKTEKRNNPESEQTFNKLETKEKGNADLAISKRKDKKAFDKGDDDVNTKREKKTSESTEGDDPFSNLRDDDLLNDLENMDIPIELEETEVCSIEKSRPSSSKSPFLDSGKDFHGQNPNLVQNESNFNKEREMEKVAKENVKEMECEKIATDNAKTMDTDKTCNKNEIHECDPIASSTTSVNASGTPNLVSSNNLDMKESKSIIRFKKIKRDRGGLITHDIDTPKTHLEVAESKKKLKTNSLNSKKLRVDKTEYMTVYKIVSSDGSMSTVTDETFSAVNSSDLTDVSTTENKEQNTIVLDSVKSRLDSFYKKFKNTYQRRSRKPEIKTINNNSVLQNEFETKTDDVVLKTNDDHQKDHINNEKENNESTLCDSCDPIKAKKAIVVSNKNRVKYCLKCSCIFDTETCAYCVRKIQCDDETISDTSLSDKESCCETVEENREESLGKSSTE